MLAAIAPQGKRMLGCLGPAILGLVGAPSAPRAGSTAGPGGNAPSAAAGRPGWVRRAGSDPNSADRLRLRLRPGPETISQLDNFRFSAGQFPARQLRVVSGMGRRRARTECQRGVGAWGRSSGLSDDLDGLGLVDAVVRCAMAAVGVNCWLIDALCLSLRSALVGEAWCCRPRCRSRRHGGREGSGAGVRCCWPLILSGGKCWFLRNLSETTAMLCAIARE
jgi:hypothetical protein